MKKKILTWVLKKYLTQKKVKELVCRMNAAFSERVKVEGKVHVFAFANDMSECIQMRLEGFADDGHIDDGELERVNAHDCMMIDKYIPEEKIGELIDRIFSK